MQHNDKKPHKLLTAAIAGGETFFSESKDKQTDSTLNIHQTPFNRDRHQQALKTGLCQDEYEKDKQGKICIEIKRMHAPSNKPGSGFGIASFREVVNKSMEKCPGSIIANVSTSYGSPHLFYLYMGMAPETAQHRYLPTTYGAVGDGKKANDALVKLSQYKKWDSLLLEQICTPAELKCLKRVVSEEEGISKKSSPVSLEDIITNQEYLLKLIDKKLDYTSEIFMPFLLKILSDDPKNKYPDTRELGPVIMHLTPQGFARWKYVIEHGLEFVPFKNFEHLNLTPTQQALLQDILTKRTASEAHP